MADDAQDRDALATNAALYRDGIEKEAAELLSGYRDKAFIYRAASDKQWRWKRVAPNNEVVGASHEGYTSFSNCVKNLERQFLLCKIADVTVEE